MARTAGLLRKERRESGWPRKHTSNGPNSHTLNGGAVSLDLTRGPLLLLSLAFEDSFAFRGRISLSAVTISGRPGSYNREKCHAWKQARRRTRHRTQEVTNGTPIGFAPLRYSRA